MVVDMQNDFVRAGAPQEVPQARATIPRIQQLLNWFRQARRPVVFTKFLAGPRETLLWRWSPECGPELRSCWPGVRRTYRDCEGDREGPAIVDELAPQPGEHVVEKYGYDAFFRTNLADHLRANDVTDVVVCGTVTHICVASTVNGAFHHGYRAVVASDAVSSYDEELHRATLRIIGAKYGRVASTEEVLAELQSLFGGEKGGEDGRAERTA
ncbi:MAG TPA: isochorismatase family cysteine hydrolase [Actinomycetota bacterium]|nr:isochorismatase family cysteine hydrolase [Actinomycetota bacterium]